MRFSLAPQYSRLLLGVFLGFILGTVLYQSQRGDLVGTTNTCIEQKANNSCPSGGVDMGTYCYLPGGAPCVEFGQQGTCGAGSCIPNQYACCANNMCSLQTPETCVSPSFFHAGMNCAQAQQNPLNNCGLPPCSAGMVTCSPFSPQATSPVCCSTGAACTDSDDDGFYDSCLSSSSSAANFCCNTTNNTCYQASASSLFSSISSMSSSRSSSSPSSSLSSSRSSSVSRSSSISSSQSCLDIPGYEMCIQGCQSLPNPPACILGCDLFYPSCSSLRSSSSPSSSLSSSRSSSVSRSSSIASRHCTDFNIFQNNGSCPTHHPFKDCGVLGVVCECCTSP